MQTGTYDLDGNPITLSQWAAIASDLDRRRLAETDVVMPDGTKCTIRTLHLGYIDELIPSLRMCGSAIRYRDPDRFREVALYDTRDQALDGHAHLVVSARAGNLPTHHSDGGLLNWKTPATAGPLSELPCPSCHTEYNPLDVGTGLSRCRQCERVFDPKEGSEQCIECRKCACTCDDEPDDDDTVTAQVIVLERIEPGSDAGYPVAGRSTCMSCPEWVWLPSEAMDPVRSGDMIPICQPCAELHPQITDDTLQGNISELGPQS